MGLMHFGGFMSSCCCMAQLGVTIFATCTLFIKPRMDHSTLEGGRLYLGYLFYTVYFMIVNAFTELSIAVSALMVVTVA